MIKHLLDFNGCESKKSLNIDVQDTPEFEVSVSNQACVYDEVPFDISLSNSTFDLLPGVNFFWTDSPSETIIFPSIDEHPTSGTISTNEVGEFTSYFYYYDSLNNETCYSSGSMTFIGNGIDFSINGDSILCDGNSTILELEYFGGPFGTFDILWEPTGDTNQPIEVSPNTSTTYVCSITDVSNCVSTDTLVMNVLCSNETFEDFEPFIVENETQALFPNISLYDSILYKKNDKEEK